MIDLYISLKQKNQKQQGFYASNPMTEKNIDWQNYGNSDAWLNDPRKSKVSKSDNFPHLT